MILLASIENESIKAAEHHLTEESCSLLSALGLVLPGRESVIFQNQCEEDVGAPCSSQQAYQGTNSGQDHPCLKGNVIC